MNKLASVIVPVFNEEHSLEHLFQGLAKSVSSLQAYDWELILVDDGSVDQTVNTIAKLGDLFPGEVRLIQFSRNFGHQPALLAGLEECRGEFAVIMDADLQDPPEMFSSFVREFESGADVVYAVRRTRQEPWLKSLAYKAFYRFMEMVTEINIPLDAGDFGLVSRRVVKLMVQYADKDLFLRGLRSWVGFRQVGIEYDRPERLAGRTKYTFIKLLKLAGDGIFGYSSVPLRFSTILGFLSVVACAFYGLYALMGKFVYHSNPPGWTSLVLVLIFMGGVQLISIGLVGEYIVRINKQVQPRPLFVIKETKILRIKPR